MQSVVHYLKELAAFVAAGFVEKNKSIYPQNATRLLPCVSVTQRAPWDSPRAAFPPVQRCAGRWRRLKIQG